MRFGCLVVAALALASPAGAIFLAPGDSVTVTLAAPAGDVALAFDGRVESKAFAGSNLVLRVSLNGRTLDAERLANKPRVFSTAAHALLTWADGDRWRLVLSPDFDPRRNAPKLPHAVTGGVPPYRFELRAGDLVRPGANVVRFEHVGRGAARIEIAHVGFVARAREPAAPRAKTAVLDAAAAPADAPAPTFRVLPGGGIEARSGALVATLETEISIPRGGWRTLGDRANSWPEIAVAGARVRAQARDLDFERRVEAGATPGCIVYRDVLVNRTTVDLGVVVRHRIVGATRVFLGGLELPVAPLEMTRFEPQAPSAVVVTPGGATGLLPACDVAWAQAESFRDAVGAGLQDASLCIAPRDSVVLEWWLVLRPGGGYWEWLDVARAALGANVSVPGGFAFGSFAMRDWPAAKLRNWIQVRGLRFVASPGPTASGSHGRHGPALLESPEALAMLRDFASAVHRAAPGVAVLAYFDAFLVDAGQAGPYAAQRVEVLDHAPLFYPGGDPKKYAVCLPAPGSRFAADQERVLDALLDLGFDGIYWDEMAYSARPWTYGAPWDGASGDLDPASHLCLRRKSAVALVAAPWIETQVQRLRAAGKVVVANTEPATFGARRLGIPRFVETAETDDLTFVHLGIPIGLGDRLRERDAADVAARIRIHLENGALYYFYSPAVALERPNLAAHMYPFTPVALRPGTLHGVERILTARSGRFGWNDASEHEVHVFDAQGVESDESGRTFEADGMRWTELHLAPGSTAAIVRRAQP